MKMRRSLIFVLLFVFLFLAGCDKPKYTIRFETNSGSPIEDRIIEKNEQFTLPQDPIREGYDFGGWFLDPDFLSPFELTYEITENITLYAKWIPHEYTVFFDSNGGSLVGNAKVKKGEFLIPPQDPTKGDYPFAGWYLDPLFITPYDFSKPVTEDLTLFAKWDIPLLELDEYEAFYIVTSPGEDASTTFNINYQIKNTKSKVEYTVATDENYQHKKVVEPHMYAFEALENVEEPFERRNICKVTLTNLEPNTKYKYRINQGNDTYSADHYFTTSGGNDTTSFIFMTDVHYYHGYDGAEISEEVIKAALEIQPNLDFVFTTGDMVDRGGNSIDWHKMLTGRESYQYLPYLGVPGNHELYGIGKGVNQVFRAYFNFPANGYREYNGVSYYFVHNDTLFINLDTNSSYDVGRQVTWLEEVLRNNQAKFIVVGTHPPFFISDNSDYKSFLVNLMERYSVDLVLAGHYHSHRFETLFEGAAPTNEYLGVTYLNGAGGGIKSIGDRDPHEFAKGYIIDILEDKIVIRYINGKGDILATYEVVNKKLSPREEATKEELIDSITATPDHENETITFTWSRKFYKNVQEMVIKEAYRDQRQEIFVFPTLGYVKYTFDKFLPDLDSLYLLDITFADGTKETIKFEYLLSGGCNLEAADIMNDAVVLTFDPPKEPHVTSIYEYEIYLNGELFTKIAAKDSKFKPITSTYLEGLKPKTKYHLVLKAYGRNGFLYSDEITFKTK